LSSVVYPRYLQPELLPQGALPDIRLSEPEIQFPERVNITAHFLDRNLAPGQADRIAYFSGERRITYRALHEAVNRLAGALRALGIAEGDRVVLRIPNCIEFVVCALALHRLGAVVVPTNVLLRERILTHIVNTSEAKAVVVHRDCLAEVDAGRSRYTTVRHMIAAGGSGADCTGYLSYERLMESSNEAVASVMVRRDALATMFFTSGTTGWPKGCMHLSLTIMAGPHVAVHMFEGIGPGDVLSGTPPLAFTFGYGNMLLLPLLAGVPCVLIEGRPKPEGIFAAIERYGITLFQSVPAAYNQMLAANGAEKGFDLRSLRGTLSGSAPLLASTFNQWEERFGIRMANGLGSSESYVSIFSRWNASPRAGSLGWPLPGFEVRAIDDEGRECPRGTVGRMAFKGPTANLYWRNPEKQVEAVEHGWSLTGDLVYQDDDGCFWHVCRGDDVIKSRGYRISPGEVEDALMEHPAVFEPAVIGAPDAIQGEKVKAFVALKEGYSASNALAEELKQFLRARLAGYQVPGEVEFVDALPKTETGKIRRKDLKELELERQASTAVKGALG
jgi:2-aminobenzoate-CoA ligase